jgi:hypothetical protein
MTDDPSGVIDAAHRQIIAAIQPVLAQYGFGLAGGNALQALGLSDRPTRDVNMFTPDQSAIRQVMPLVERALRDAGFDARLSQGDDQIAHAVRDAADWHAEWIVIVDGRRILLHLGFHELLSPPAPVGDIGPVLDIRDVLGEKVLALTDRLDARDFIDVFRAMQKGWSPERLIDLAWRVNPQDYAADDFTRVLPALAEIDDFEFTQYGLSAGQVAELRERFQQWPVRSG